MRKFFRKKGRYIILAFALHSLWNTYLSDIEWNSIRETETIPYQVIEGDSIWSIAKQINPNKSGEISYQIQELNEISEHIYPGMVIQVPVSN